MREGKGEKGRNTRVWKQRLISHPPQMYTHLPSLPPAAAASDEGCSPLPPSEAPAQALLSECQSLLQASIIFIRFP